MMLKNYEKVLKMYFRYLLDTLKFYKKRLFKDILDSFFDHRIVIFRLVINIEKYGIIFIESWLCV